MPGWEDRIKLKMTRWTEGPEGKANGGAGTPFWYGKFIGHGSDDGSFGSVNGMFQNWGNGEPNGNAEDYLQISQAIQPDGSTGAWNDLWTLELVVQLTNL